MKNGITLFFATLLFVGTAMAQKPQTAADFFGYELGAQFTFHHRIVDYVNHVAEKSPSAIVEKYGETYEGRELVTLIISSPENLASLDQIRKNNLIKAGLLQGEVSGKQVPVVWLNFNIHGDEASASEAGLATIEALTQGSDKEAEKWLKEVVVIVDPCVNPDGREHFISWYKRSRNAVANPNTDAQEHHHPYASGRQNHYLVDLNRDWAWQTQIESKTRLTMYKNWMPQVHCDFHEMGHEEDYFFAPAARPLHEDITQWQRLFQQYVGQNHAKKFDAEGWLYYTQADFDLFYPSYGDTWPIFNGSLGFTFEQGGSRNAGIVVDRSNGNKLTLKERMDHHKVSALSVIQVAYVYRDKIVSEYNDYFSESQSNPAGEYKSYVIKGKGNPDAVKALLELLNKQQITYGTTDKARTVKAFDYQKNKMGSFQLETTDVIVNTAQPLSHLVKVLFEPKSILEDSMTYDATAWALPYVYNLECYAVKESLATPNKVDITKRPLAFSSVPYAWLSDWNDVKDMRFLAELMKDKVKVRYSTGKFSIGGKVHMPGTLIVLKSDNVGMDDAKLIAAVNKAIRITDQEVMAVQTGMTPKGQELGHYSMLYMTAPKVALLTSKGVSTTHFGAYWWFFEQELNYPIHVIRLDDLGKVDLSEYDVVIAPDGHYRTSSKTLLKYAKAGGKLIVVGSAISSFTNVDDEGKGTALGEAIEESSDAEEEGPTSDSPPIYGEAGRKSLSEISAGCIYKVKLDATHPLGFGAGGSYYSMKTNSTAYPFLADGSGWNVGRFETDAYVSGFAGYKLKEKLKNTMAVSVEDYGQGQIVYFADTPIYRDFWHGGKILLGNAIFFVGQ